MATVTVSFTTVTQNFPSGTVPGQYSVAITGGTAGAPAIPVQMVAASPATFLSVPTEGANDPDYVATVTLLDANSAPLGAPQTATFSVLSPPVVGNVPGVVSVAVAP